MGKTRQLSVTTSPPTAITVFAVGAADVRITENKGVAGWPTTDLLIYKPTSGDTPVRVPAGSDYTFLASQRMFNAGDTVGFVATVAGTTTLDIDEDSP